MITEERLSFFKRQDLEIRKIEQSIVQTLKEMYRSFSIENKTLALEIIKVILSKSI